MSKKKAVKKKPTPPPVPPALSPELKAACRDIVDDLYSEIEGKCFAQIAVLNHKITKLEERLAAVEAHAEAPTRSWWSMVSKLKGAELPG